jgi:hypothetical protein
MSKININGFCLVNITLLALKMNKKYSTSCYNAISFHLSTKLAYLSSLYSPVVREVSLNG